MKNNDSFDWYMKYLNGIINVKIEKKVSQTVFVLDLLKKIPSNMTAAQAVVKGKI